MKNNFFNQTYCQGQIWLADYPSANSKHYVIIISNDNHNYCCKDVIMVPISHSDFISEEVIPITLFNDESYVQCNNIAPIKKFLLKRYIATVAQDVLVNIVNKIAKDVLLGEYRTNTLPTHEFVPDSTKSKKNKLHTEISEKTNDDIKVDVDGAEKVLDNSKSEVKEWFTDDEYNDFLIVNRGGTKYSKWNTDKLINFVSVVQKCKDTKTLPKLCAILGYKSESTLRKKLKSVKEEIDKRIL